MQLKDETSTHECEIPLTVEEHINSAAAKFATKKLTRDRRVRFGSKMTARITKRLPVTAVTVRKEQVVAVVMLKVIGAVTFEHGYAPIKAISWLALTKSLEAKATTIREPSL